MHPNRVQRKKHQPGKACFRNTHLRRENLLQCSVQQRHGHAAAVLRREEPILSVLSVDSIKSQQSRIGKTSPLHIYHVTTLTFIISYPSRDRINVGEYKAF